VSKVLAAHWPHLIFVAIGVVAFFWAAYKPERTADDRTGAAMPAGAELAAPAPKAGTVGRSVARRGLLALGPLLGAAATGAVLYGLDVGGGAVPGAVIWIHSGISLLALLLVVYKVGDLGVARIRRAFSRERVAELVSVILGVLSVPLLATGIGLLLAPSTSSFFAYAHLVSATWWTGLLVWHLRRYVGASLRTALRPRDAQAPATPAGVVPAVRARGDRVQWRTSGD
jgi:hypothetical protein